MTRLAVLADIHGKDGALAAVLDQSPDALFTLGDCFSRPLDAARTAHLLAGSDFAATVRGNHDRWLSDLNAMDAWDRHAHSHLGPQNACMAGLAARHRRDRRCLALQRHATPHDDLTYWLKAGSYSVFSHLACLSGPLKCENRVSTDKAQRKHG